MAHGIQIFNSSGAVTFDSNSAYLGAIAEVFQGTSTVTKTYPNFAGRSALVLTLDGSQASGATADTTLGYPRVITPGTSWVATYLVFIL